MAEKAVLKGNNDLTVNLYKILARNGGNVFFSPISIHAILSLAAQGAGGKTKTDLTSILNVPDVKVAAEGYKEIMTRLNNIADVTLHMANKVYLKDKFKLQEAFKSIVTSHFLSDVELLNFAQSRQAARTINTWVEQKTNNKIKNVIDSNDLNKNTRLMLVNAIYFKGKWEQQFNPKMTKTKKFYLDGTATNTVDVQMMHLMTDFCIKNDANLDAKVLKMPYINSAINMIIILPNARDGIAKLEEKLAQTDLSNITMSMYKREVNVSLPKFKIETTINLENALTELSLEDMFSERADFSSMLDGSEPLCVSKMVQKAFIEVNEEGSKAAAATGSQCYEKCDIPPVNFIADHPFLVLLQIKQGLIGGILFMGRVKNPQHS